MGNLHYTEGLLVHLKAVRLEGSSQDRTSLGQGPT